MAGEQDATRETKVKPRFEVNYLEYGVLATNYIVVECLPVQETI